MGGSDTPRIRRLWDDRWIFSLANTLYTACLDTVYSHRAIAGHLLSLFLCLLSHRHNNNMMWTRYPKRNLSRRREIQYRSRVRRQISAVEAIKALETIILQHLFIRNHFRVTTTRLAPACVSPPYSLNYTFLERRSNILNFSCRLEILYCGRFAMSYGIRFILREGWFTVSLQYSLSQHSFIFIC
jgi:hypothetical protein